jgi:nucleoid-associated protein YgaU
LKFQESYFKKVSLESLDWSESAENGLDIKVSVTFKEYVEYGAVKRTVIEEKKAVVNETPKKNTSNGTTTDNYTVRKGDCLWKISKKFYGTGTKWKTIYNANKTIIENTARKYGKKDSSNGHWIYPNTKLVIPNVPKK